MILTNNDKLISYLDANIFTNLLPADQKTFDNSVNPHGLATGFNDFYKKDINSIGSYIINMIHHILNNNIVEKNIDLFVLQIYDYGIIKKTYYIKPQNFHILLETIPSSVPHTKRLDCGSFPLLFVGF